MTAARTVASTYVSGWCGSGAHEQCRGLYAGVVCCCRHHTEPEPPDVDLLPELDVMDDLLEEPTPVRHCPTCTCDGRA